MLPHPKTMQTMTDQRWHELQVKTHRERLAMTTHGQTRRRRSPDASAASSCQRRANAAADLRPPPGNQNGWRCPATGHPVGWRLHAAKRVMFDVPTAGSPAHANETTYARLTTPKRVIDDVQRAIERGIAR